MTLYEKLGARLLIQARSRQARTRPSLVLASSGRRSLTPLRSAIAAELYDAPFSYPEVGELMHRDHSTIQYLVKGRRR